MVWCLFVGGVLIRCGYIEVVLDLVVLVGLFFVGVLCEVVNDDDGLMVCFLYLKKFVKEYGIFLILIDEFVKYCFFLCFSFLYFVKFEYKLRGFINLLK